MNKISNFIREYFGDPKHPMAFALAMLLIVVYYSLQIISIYIPSKNIFAATYTVLTVIVFTILFGLFAPERNKNVVVRSDTTDNRPSQSSS